MINFEVTNIQVLQPNHLPQMLFPYSCIAGGIANSIAITCNIVAVPPVFTFIPSSLVYLTIAVLGLICSFLHIVVGAFVVVVVVRVVVVKVVVVRVVGTELVVISEHSLC